MPRSTSTPTPYEGRALGLANYLGPLLSRTRPLGAVLVAGQVVGVLLLAAG